MQAAAGGQVETARLAKHGAGNTGTQALLHGPQHIVAMARPGDDQAVGGKAEGAKAGPEQIAPSETPQRRSTAIDEAGKQGPGKTLRRTRTISPGPAGDDLVQRTTRQAAPGQSAIDRR